MEIYDDQNAPRSLYIGHLHPKVSEELLSELFSKYGEITSCKVFPESPGQDPYAFVEFKKREDADHARAAMHDRRIFDKNIVVRFATNKTNQKRDLSNDYHIFVGDLSPEIAASDLAKAFQDCGKITSVRIMKDNNTGKSKGFAFVSFQNKTDAEKAIEDMNGQFIGHRQIRTNWASRRGPGDEGPGGARGQGMRQISYSEALTSSTNTNTTVYFGNLPENVTDTELKELVGEYGNITDVKVFADKRYAFIRMATHEEAAMCIAKVHGNILRDQYIKVFWGKENSTSQGGNNSRSGQGFNNSNYQAGEAGGQPNQAQGGQGGYGDQNQNYNQYVQNYWNQYYQQYYQYMDPNQQGQGTGAGWNNNQPAGGAPPGGYTPGSGGYTQGEGNYGPSYGSQGSHGYAPSKEGSYSSDTHQQDSNQYSKEDKSSSYSAPRDNQGYDQGQREQHSGGYNGST